MLSTSFYFFGFLSTSCFLSGAFFVPHVLSRKGKSAQLAFREPNLLTVQVQSVQLVRELSRGLERAGIKRLGWKHGIVNIRYLSECYHLKVICFFLLFSGQRWVIFHKSPKPKYWLTRLDICFGFVFKSNPEKKWAEF